jgi:carboxylesterase type B
LKPDTPRAFVGIPFADPPILTLRFKPPQPFSKPWNTKNPNKVRKAVTYSKACIQPLPKRQGEDCLYLNVFVPHPERVEKWTKQGKKLPVLVWIQGGAFILGSSSEYRIYDGHYLTKKQDVLVVTLNYRMGAFGFLVGSMAMR